MKNFDLVNVRLLTDGFAKQSVDCTRFFMLSMRTDGSRAIILVSTLNSVVMRFLCVKSEAVSREKNCNLRLDKSE